MTENVAISYFKNIIGPDFFSFDNKSNQNSELSIHEKSLQLEAVGDNDIENIQHLMRECNNTTEVYGDWRNYKESLDNPQSQNHYGGIFQPNYHSGGAQSFPGSDSEEELSSQVVSDFGSDEHNFTGYNSDQQSADEVISGSGTGFNPSTEISNNASKATSFVEKLLGEGASSKVMETIDAAKQITQDLYQNIKQEIEENPKAAAATAMWSATMLVGIALLISLTSVLLVMTYKMRRASQLRLR